MRKDKNVTISADTAPSVDARDYGKTFYLKEMSCMDAERWARRATHALLPRLSQQVPEDVAEQLKENPSLPSLSKIGLLLGGIDFPETDALLDDIMKCVSVVERNITRPVGHGGAEDIEDVETLLYLRKEVFALHTNFILPASLFNLIGEVSRIDISQIL